MSTNPLSQQLFQVFVTTSKGTLEPKGPKWGQRFAAKLCEDINRAIISGKEREWKEAVVMPVQSLSQTPSLVL